MKQKNVKRSKRGSLPKLFAGHTDLGMGNPKFAKKTSMSKSSYSRMMRKTKPKTNKY